MADEDENFEYIFRPFITRNGRRIWAREYGFKAWRIRIRKRKK